MSKPRPVIMVGFYVGLLLSMALVLWVISPSDSPKVWFVLLAWALLVGRVYLEVHFRRSSWTRVLRLSTTSTTSEPFDAFAEAEQGRPQG
jgi:hypothetical protein